jgi:hypothetical protein
MPNKFSLNSIAAFRLCYVLYVQEYLSRKWRFSMLGSRGGLEGKRKRE